jgi:hypothetical protein
MVLETTFETESGTIVLLDAMAVGPNDEGPPALTQLGASSGAVVAGHDREADRGDDPRLAHLVGHPPGICWAVAYTWVRDASLTLEALWVAACPDEAHRFFTWMAAAATYLRPLPPGDSTVGWSRSGTRYRRRSRPRDQRSLGYRQLGSGRCQHVGDVAANAGWSPDVGPNWGRSGYAAPGDQPEVAAGGSWLNSERPGPSTVFRNRVERWRAPGSES